MEELIRDYKATLRAVNRARFVVKDEESKHLLSSSASDLGYSIHYMILGREPGSRRAITRRSYIQREKVVSPHLMAQVFRAKEGLAPQANLQDLVDDLLATLTPAEAQVLYMVKAIGYSHGYAAQLMGYKSRGAIQQLVERAMEKLQSVVQMPHSSKRVILNKPIQRVMF
ncbi:MAG: sigma factor-like helix-turn-helix DNA-binding protein [Bacillota bacterium]